MGLLDSPELCEKSDIVSQTVLRITALKRG